MATKSNTSFHMENTLNSVIHGHDIPFQPGTVNSPTSHMISIGSYYGANSSTGNLMFCDNSSIISSASSTSSAAGSSSSPLLLNSVPGLKHDVGLAVEWTEEEQYMLEEALVKYKDEAGIMKHIKVAAIFRDKTVRDVALRCRWMMKKRRKQEESNMGRKGGPKDKFEDTSLMTNLPSASVPNLAPNSFKKNQMDLHQRVNCQLLSSKAKQLLEQNLQAFNQIDHNITCLKWQDNIDLFCRARNNIGNINVILNNMRQFSGKMSQMQDLPISIDQNLVNNILPRTTL